MKVFISINGLKCGGAEKSLISFLNEIPLSYREKNNLEVDLLVLDKKDIFFTNVPGWVNRLVADPYVDGIFETTKEHLKNPVSPIVLERKLLTKVRMKTRKIDNAMRVQRIWECWKTQIPLQPKKYDLAISYVDGFSNYYVMDKVHADKKVLWVHNEYEKLNYNPVYDKDYFLKADAIVTISDLCVESLLKTFPEIKGKVWMIPNISSQQTIWAMSEEETSEDTGDGNILVSVGRLNEQKGFDMAIDAAAILAKDLDFKWYILGEGELRDTLENQIREKGIDDKVFLLGNRSNPYAYIRKASVFVQPSRYEGKSIVLDEAKILEKPIIVTNYATVYDSIKDGENGVIVDFDPEKLANALKKLLSDKDMQAELSGNLHEERQKSNKDIDKYLSLIDTIYER